MEKEYFLGLDMGTGSVGWAVTDNSYEILRSHGKSLWGVRLFESANTAEERRMFRTARRRLDRRNWRIQILQELFAEEIAAVDPGFYLRMKERKLPRLTLCLICRQGFYRRITMHNFQRFII